MASFRLAFGFASTFEGWGFEDVDFGGRLVKSSAAVAETSLVGREDTDTCIIDVFATRSVPEACSQQPGPRDVQYIDRAAARGKPHTNGNSGAVTLLRCELSLLTSHRGGVLAGTKACITQLTAVYGGYVSEAHLAELPAEN